MATHLDLEEQEQLDQLKHFWNTYGNLITWVADRWSSAPSRPGTAGSTGSATRPSQASALYDEVERAAQAGDVARVERAFADMKDKFGGTTYAQQAGLLAAKALVRQGQGRRGPRRAGLGGRQGVRRRLPGRRAAAAGRPCCWTPRPTTRRSSSSPAPLPKEFEALVADRRGDIYMAAGQEGRGQGRVHQGLDRRSTRGPTTAAWSRSSSTRSASTPSSLAPAPAGAASASSQVMTSCVLARRAVRRRSTVTARWQACRSARRRAPAAAKAQARRTAAQPGADRRAPGLDGAHAGGRLPAVGPRSAATR